MWRCLTALALEVQTHPWPFLNTNEIFQHVHYVAPIRWELIVIDLIRVLSRHKITPSYCLVLDVLYISVIAVKTRKIEKSQSQFSVTVLNGCYKWTPEY